MAESAEGGTLLRCYMGQPVSWVRIPPSPNRAHYQLIVSFIFMFFIGVSIPTHGYLHKGEKYLNNQIDYIHYNPVKHGYAKSVKDG